VLWGNVECCKALIEGGADIDKRNTLSGATPLHMAAASTKNPEGVFECMQLLVAAGADCDMQDFQGRPPWKLTLDDDVRSLLGAPPAGEDSDDDIRNFPGGLICRPCAPSAKSKREEIRPPVLG
jgi:ankyrin repeat protein